MLAKESSTASPRRSFADAFNPKNNAFGFLRLALAVSVIFSHSYPLGGFGIDSLEAATDGSLTIGLAAVGIFFVLSGFLISRSAAHTSSIPRFLWHRFLRIMPGYWVCLILCACLFAPLVALHQYGLFFRVFSAPGNSPQAYILGNAGLFHFQDSLHGVLNVHPQSIAGLLRHNPFPYTINGSLWTLSFEVVCYFAVAALAAVGVFRRARYAVLGAFVALLSLHVLDFVDPATFREMLPSVAAKPLVMLGVFFAAGSTCFVYREKIPYSTPLFVIALGTQAASVPLGAFELIAPFALTYAFLWLAFALPFGRFDRPGDFSYGTYIYSFPVQQGMAQIRLHESGFTAYFVSALLLTFVLAFLSYRFIEAPALRLKSLSLASFRRSRSMIANVAAPDPVLIPAET